MNMFAERDARNAQEDMAFDRCGQFSVNTDPMIQSATPTYNLTIDQLRSINSELSHEVIKLKEEIKVKELQDQVLHGIIDKLINALAKNSKCN